MKRRRKPSNWLSAAIMGLALVDAALLDGRGTPAQIFWVTLAMVALVPVMWFFSELDR